MKYLQDTIFNGITLNTSYSSLPIDTRYITMCSFQAIVGAGSSSGNLQIQVSNEPNVANNWSTLTTSQLNISAAGNVIIPYTEIAYQWIRLIYNDTSGGTGTSKLTVQMSAKGF